MISLQPINKRIRETLHKKSQAVSRDFTGSELLPKNLGQKNLFRKYSCLQGAGSIG